MNNDGSQYHEILERIDGVYAELKGFKKELHDFNYIQQQHSSRFSTNEAKIRDIDKDRDTLKINLAILTAQVNSSDRYIREELPKQIKNEIGLKTVHVIGTIIATILALAVSAGIVQYVIAALTS